MDLYDPPSAAVVVIGTTAISGGTNTRVLFDDSGVIGESAGLTYIKASGLLASTAMAIGGATIGTNGLAVTGTALFNSATTISGALTYGGVTLANAVTGTGNMVLATSPTLNTGATVKGPDNTAAVSFSVLRSSLDFGLVLTTTGASGNNTINALGGGTTTFQTGGTSILLLGTSSATIPNDRGLLFTSQSSSAGAQVGTLTNAPTAGNPGFWLKIAIGGTSYSVPAWLG